MSGVALPAMLLVFLIAFLVIATTWIKRWIRRSPDPGGPVWTLHELRRLRDSGEITIQQFERLSAQSVSQVAAGESGAMKAKPPAGKPNPTDPITVEIPSCDDPPQTEKAPEQW